MSVTKRKELLRLAHKRPPSCPSGKKVDGMVTQALPRCSHQVKQWWPEPQGVNEIFPGLMSCPPPCLSLLEGPEAAANNPYAVQIRISPYNGGNAPG